MSHEVTSVGAGAGPPLPSPVTSAALTWPLVGHAREVGFLQQAIRGNRVAHAYLFVGAPGSGKRSLALAFAMTLNCQSATAAGGPRLVPCGACPSCHRIARYQDPDVLLLDIERQREIAAGSGREADAEKAARQRIINVATAHELRDHITARPPYDARYKIAILGDADTMNDAAANSLLKTLEEPPRWAVIILLSANEGGVPATIRSRCQLISLRPVPRDIIRAALNQRNIAPDRADLLAALAEGRPGVALTAAADPATFAERSAALALLHTIVAPDALIADRFKVAAQLATAYSGGPGGRASVTATLELWLMWWRDLLLISSGHPELITNLDQLPQLKQLAARLNPPAIHARIIATQTALTQLAAGTNPRLVLENLVL